ncbi:MAG: serine--tRNA ligase [Methanobacteriota archaeon]
MLDPKLVRENPDVIRRDLEKRNDGAKLELLGQVVAQDAEWRKLTEEVNNLRHERNDIARKIAETKKAKGDATALMERAAEIPRKIDEAGARLDELRHAVDAGLMRLPNILHESVPVGKDDVANVVVMSWGEPRAFDFELKNHGELAEALGLADFDRAARISGAGFNYLKGDLALLDLALVNYAVHFMTSKGYTLVEPPYMMRREAYEGVTDLSDFENVMYKIEGEDLYMIATSEHPMAAMYMGEIIDEDLLPIKLVGMSPCFRREIGARGVDTKGLFRMHQFNKVEQFIFCRPEDSWKFHEELQSNSEEMIKGLGLPFRVVNVCTGDIGTLAAKKYDIEVWFPRQGKYGEVTSCSNDTDYQARRLGIRYGKHGGEKKGVPHTLNNTAIATSRIMVAILENCQNADGSVTIPEALRKYMGGKDRMPEGGSG